MRQHPLLPHGDRYGRSLLGHGGGLRKAGAHRSRSAVHGRAGRRPALASNVAWSPSPISVNYHSGFWVSSHPQDQAINEAISIVPTNPSVSATFHIDDHMTHRVLIYEYPNPWVVTNWGISLRHPPNPAKVDWLVLDTRATGNQPALYQALIVKREFDVVFT